jgi:hypothetical protein
MKCYALGEIDVTDPAWVREYVAQVTAHRAAARRATPRAHAAHRDARGRARSARDAGADRVPHTRGGARLLRQRRVPPLPRRPSSGARNEFMLIAGEDVTGVARIEA